MDVMEMLTATSASAVHVNETIWNIPVSSIYVLNSNDACLHRCLVWRSFYTSTDGQEY